jgi:hypothetical protein
LFLILNLNISNSNDHNSLSIYYLQIIAKHHRSSFQLIFKA